MLTSTGRQLRLTFVEPARLTAAAHDVDPHVGLGAVAALRRLVEQLEALQVDSARAAGWSWARIACELQVSKQAVHRKHAVRRLGLRR
jgi:hypothetical protein